jgi:iron(III) transport system permease protein
MSGAGTFAMMRRVTFPLAWPAILAVGLLAFVRASEAFEVPAVVGMPGGVDVVTTRVYEAVTRGLVPNYGYANALSVVLAIVVGLLLWRYNLLSKKGERYQVVSGEAYRPGVLDIGGWKYLCTAIQVFLFTVGVALPMVVLAWVSLVPVYQGANSTMLHFTTANYREAMAAPALLEGAANTVLLCLGSALVACLLTALVAWFVVRRSAGAAVLDHLVSVPMIVPGIVVGIAIAQVGLSSPVPIYGTVWILGLGYFVTFLPFTMRFAYSGVIQIRHDLEESALVSGASRTQIFVKIVLPLLSTSLVMGGIFSFMQGARALSMPIFLASPEHPVAAVSLYDAYVNGSTTVVAAFGLTWTAVMVAVSSFVFWLSRRSKVAVL